MKKKFMGIIVCLMFGLSGIFLGMSLRIESLTIYEKKKKEYLDKRMKDNYDNMIRLVNGKPKKVKY